MSHLQVGPNKKRIEIDTIQDDDVRTLNSLFPKIDNLEYFPLKVLIQIFTNVGDMDLLRLAENSSRFQRIAKLVLNERYAEKYFTMNSTMYDSLRTYKDFIQIYFQLYGLSCVCPDLETLKLKQINLLGVQRLHHLRVPTEAEKEYDNDDDDDDDGDFYAGNEFLKRLKFNKLKKFTLL